MPPLVTFISATRSSEELFWASSPLGLSVKRLSLAHPQTASCDEFDLNVIYRSCIFFENSKGLSEIYNFFIEQRLSLEYNSGVTDEILVFIHDDVWIDDANVGQHLVDSLKEFDVVGVLGSVDRAAGQANWAYLPVPIKLNGFELLSNPNMGGVSGSISGGVNPCGDILYYGPWKRECELLDGVFLAVRKQTLSQTSLRFDPCFDFHFYDLDFCRAARTHGLRLGTWPISLTHQSVGAVGEDWLLAHSAYLSKWGD
jgi:hypothetical protein